MSGPAIPPRAIQAAAEAMQAREHDYGEDPWTENARVALEAAAPRIWAAAWRDGYGQGRDDEAQNLPLREKFQAASRSGQYMILPPDTGERVAEAVAAERERIAQLADQLEYPSFADLLRDRP